VKQGRIFIDFWLNREFCADYAGFSRWLALTPNRGLCEVAPDGDKPFRLAKCEISGIASTAMVDPARNRFGPSRRVGYLVELPENLLRVASSTQSESLIRFPLMARREIADLFSVRNQLRSFRNHSLVAEGFVWSSQLA
jgi:hypothetical protein